jgi:hypothetical protein
MFSPSMGSKLVAAPREPDLVNGPRRYQMWSSSTETRSCLPSALKSPTAMSLAKPSFLCFGLWCALPLVSPDAEPHRMVIVPV